MERHTSSLPDFLSAPLETIRHSLSSTPSSPSSTLPSSPPAPPLTASNPTLLHADLPAYLAARQQYSRALTSHKLQRALYTLHTDCLPQLLGNERQQQRAVASMVTRSGVVSVVQSGLVECESEVGAMDELLGELVVRLKALDGIVARLPPLAASDCRAASVVLQR